MSPDILPLALLDLSYAVQKGYCDPLNTENAYRERQTIGAHLSGAMVPGEQMGPGILEMLQTFGVVKIS